MASEQIDATDLVNDRDVEALITNLLPVDEAPCFSELLQALDAAEERSQ